VILADRSQVFRVVRGTNARLPDPFSRKRGRVLVDALGANGTRGPSAVARIK